jgi:hypothetical protein
MTLLLLAPIFGELVSGHQTLLQFLNPLSFILSALPYGFGAIICRELVVRWGKGWVSLVLLGIAYGIYEEFIVARSVWDPDWAELGALRDYSYWGGITWTYAAVLLHFHLTVSIIASVVVAELLYPEQRQVSWVTNRQLMGCFIGLGLWLPVLWLINPFVPSPGALAFSWLAIAGLALLAWRLPAQPLAARSGTAARPVRYGVLAGVNTTAVFVTVFILPEVAVSRLPPWPVSFAFVIALDLLALGWALRWSGNGFAWDDRHKLALVAGILSFYIGCDVLQDLEEFGGLVFVAAGTVWGLRALWRRTQSRYQAGGLRPPDRILIS